MLDGMLLVKIIQCLGGVAEVLQQLATHDARLLPRLALLGAVAQRLLHQPRQDDDPPIVRRDDLRFLQSGMAERPQRCGGLIESVAARAAVQDLQQSLLAVRPFHQPFIDERAAAQAFAEAIARQQIARIGASLRSFSVFFVRLAVSAAGLVAVDFLPGLDGNNGMCAADGSLLNASMKSMHEGKRFSGSLASARPTAVRSPDGSAFRFGSILVCCTSSCRPFLPPNGNVPVSSSWKTIARLYWSQCAAQAGPRNSSGAA